MLSAACLSATLEPVGGVEGGGRLNRIFAPGPEGQVLQYRPNKLLKIGSAVHEWQGACQ